jgi:hypothetical protein
VIDLTSPGPIPSADLHVHAVMRAEDADDVAEALRALRRRGLQRMWVYAQVVPMDAAAYADRVTRLPVQALAGYRGGAGTDFIETARQFLAGVTDGPEFDIIPQVEHVDTEVRERLDDLLRHRDDVVAVKIVHDPDLTEEPQGELEAVHAEVLGALADRGVRAIVHLDLRRSEQWVRSLLGDLPDLRLTIAHLGYSRARMGPVLDEFDNVTGDIANLAAHLLAKPESYRAFLERYAGRIVFGSDAFLGDLSAIEHHGRALASIGLSDEALDAVLHRSLVP